MSCNGCRVLRKGCSDECMLRQSLQWIHSPQAQAHATIFVAKFFGRAGLMSFISAVPQHQRPALFQSLLYEAVGRTVNPVNGAVGLLWTGNWQVCESAVEKVFRGGSLDPLPESLAGSDRHHKACSEFCYTAGTTEQQQQRRRSSAVTAAAATATDTPRVAAKKRALDHEVVIVGDQLQPVIAVPADDDQLDLCLMMSKPRAATPSEEESGTTTLGSSSGGSTPADCTTSLDNVDGGRRRKLLRLFI